MSECDYVGIYHILRHRTVPPTEAKDFTQFDDDSPFAALSDLSRNVMFPRFSARRETVQGFAEFFEMRVCPAALAHAVSGVQGFFSYNVLPDIQLRVVLYSASICCA